jgi:hypothetical protein
LIGLAKTPHGHLFGGVWMLFFARHVSLEIKIREEFEALEKSRYAILQVTDKKAIC